ncbi:MAG: hypothetical protein LBD18_03150 [Treponema sp.]|nr:hypothetical protein [Treponema sp.]
MYAGYSGWGENISRGKGMAAVIAAEFIRDSGVQDKGHRINIANPSFNRVGIACCNNLVVMQFGSGIVEKNP